MKTLLYKQGILLKVSSWENDGDISRHIEYTVNSIEEGKALHRMCSTLFQSGGPLAIANDYGVSLENYEDEINEFFDEDEYWKIVPEEDRISRVEEIAENLMGPSEEGYSCRVCDNCQVFEVKEDIYLDKIEI